MSAAISGRERPFQSTHLVGSLEVLLCISNQLSVSRMIHGLKAHDFWFERVLVPLDVSEQMKLGGRRADDENLPRVIERACDVAKKVLRVVRVLSVAILVDLL